MATLIELDGLLGSPTLLARLKGAVLVAADTVRQESAATVNHANRATWAAGVFRDPAAAAQLMLPAVLAANNAASVAQIGAATDSAIVTAVLGAIDIVAGLA